MSDKETGILKKLYFVSGCIFLFAFCIILKLFNIQFIQGDKYRSLAVSRTIKDFSIPANRGNLYSHDGSILATSVPKYDIRIDLVTPSNKNFQTHVQALSDSISNFFNSNHYRAKDFSIELQKNLRKARKNNHRYFLIARNLDYSEYLRFRSFPLLNLGAYRGGLIVEQSTKREYPFGEVARRSIGYEKIDHNGRTISVGIDGAFGEKYLRGIDGNRLKQSIGNGKWKPIEDYNQNDPKDGFDLYTTIDINIQDIAHHALLEQLELYKADHGSVIVMETKSGKIRAISNLGRNSKGYYSERLNYAIAESHEPGSTFKLMALAVALDDNKIDTTTIVNTKNGVLTFYDKRVEDSKKGGYGMISVGEAFEVSSNTGLVTAIYNSYKDKPTDFIDGLYRMNLNQPLSLPIKGEGNPTIPDPREKNNLWSGISLQWMAFGYGVEFTPLQILTFYNAIANEGKMVKPRFKNKVKSINKTIKVFNTEIINPQICKPETIYKLKALLKNVVEKPNGTAHALYSENLSMAGKTGTCQKNYNNKDELDYISTFAGFFPYDSPKYSCIVVIHEPDKSIGYYGADVSGPVFKKIAKKIYTNTPKIERIQSTNLNSDHLQSKINQYSKMVHDNKSQIPNLVGLPGMDAISILENMNFNVQIIGKGKVVKQSVKNGIDSKKETIIILELSWFY